jgi:hypothetical protein
VSAYHLFAKMRKAAYVHFCRYLPDPLTLGIAIIADRYQAYVPDRYSANLATYIRRGGTDDGECLQTFLQDNEPRNCGDLPRYYFLRLVCDQLRKEGIFGDVAELGVYKGSTAFVLAQHARRIGSTAYLLDTFEGFPAEDLIGSDADKPLEFADTSLVTVKMLVGEANVVYLPGYFPETASRIPEKARFSLVHIDCDLYNPCRAALNYFYPRLVSGAFMVIHDYSSLYWDGIEEAVDRFFVDKPEKVILIPDKSGSAVIRKI